MWQDGTVLWGGNKTLCRWACRIRRPERILFVVGVGVGFWFLAIVVGYGDDETTTNFPASTLLLPLSMLVSAPGSGSRVERCCPRLQTPIVLQILTECIQLEEVYGRSPSGSAVGVQLLGTQLRGTSHVEH